MSSARLIELLTENPPLEETRGSIGIGQSLEATDVVRLAHNGSLLHVVQKDGLAFDSEVRTSSEMLANPRKFLDNPIEVILGADSTGRRPSFRIKCEVSRDKRTVLDEFDSFMAGLPAARTIEDQARLIADELFTNGAKNGFDQTKGIFVGQPVQTGTVELMAEADSQRLVIGCRDSFGLLDPKIVVDRILTCYDRGVAESIRFGSGGAGIGSYMIFDACLSYYVGTEAGRCTTVCVTLPMGMRRKLSSMLPKNIHLLSGSREKPKDEN